MNRPRYAKVAPPRLHGAIIPRKRLFHCLDRLAEAPVTWISSPAGSGKTTLIASYIHERRIPALWYRVDESDSDVATFFYYMAEAAKSLRKGRKYPLPLFAPDFRLGIDAFVRHYFTALFSKMPTAGLLVFDNFQGTPESCQFHDVIKNGLRILPEGVRAIIASRREPPPPFISLKAERHLTTLEWEDLRFTLDEVKEMMQGRANGPVSDETVQQVYEETQGWAAAVILMMDEGQRPAPKNASIGSSSVFDYLAIEVFRKLDERTRDFLCKTALLPSVSPEVASEVTGVEDADSILSFLNRNHYFTEWHGAEYTYHPLFREFLLRQGKRTCEPESLRNLQVGAAQVLSRSGRVGDSVRLLLDAKAYEEAVPLMIGHAPQLTVQGRTETLEEWSKRLPHDMKENIPWLSYWIGMGKLIPDPRESRRLLEHAFDIFAAQQDRMGCLFTAAGIINSILLSWDDCRPFDHWIDWIADNVALDVELSPPDLEAWVASAMVCGIAWRRPSYPHALAWAQRAERAMRGVNDPIIQAATLIHVITYYGVMGDMGNVIRLGEEVSEAVLSSSAPPLVRLTFATSAGFIRGRSFKFPEESLAAIREMIALAEQIGDYFHLPMICFSAAVVVFEADDSRLAEEFLKKMEHLAHPSRRAFLARFLGLRSFAHLSANRLAEALRDAEEGARAAEQIGFTCAAIYDNVTVAYALRRLGRRGDAHERLKRAEALQASLGVTHHLYVLRLAQASLFLDEGKRAEGRKALGEAFRIGSERGYALTFYWYWQPDEMARLCREALTAGIEVEYAKELIRQRKLVPADYRPEDLADWPWPVMIRTFGGFELLVNGVAPSDAKKRPLDLLKSLISLGGDEVRQEMIEDALWPESDGDMASISFKTTLSRLRKTIGDKTIEVKEGKVSINRRLVWLDVWALETLAERVAELYRKTRGTVPRKEMERLVRLVFDIYRGDFLPKDEVYWIDSKRDKLKGRFTRTIERLGRMLTDAGGRNKAQALYEQAADLGIPLKG